MSNDSISTLIPKTQVTLMEVAAWLAEKAAAAIVGLVATELISDQMGNDDDAHPPMSRILKSLSDIVGEKLTDQTLSDCTAKSDSLKLAWLEYRNQTDKADKDHLHNINNESRDLMTRVQQPDVAIQGILLFVAGANSQIASLQELGKSDPGELVSAKQIARICADYLTTMIEPVADAIRSRLDRNCATQWVPAPPPHSNNQRFEAWYNFDGQRVHSFDDGGACTSELTDRWASLEGTVIKPLVDRLDATQGLWDAFAKGWIDSRSRVGFQSRKGYWITADNGGGAGVSNRKNYQTPEDWELFDYYTRDNHFALRTYDGQFVTATNDKLEATRWNINDWEEFTMKPSDGGTVGLQTSENRYVSANQGGNNFIELKPALLEDERFTLYK